MDLERADDGTLRAAAGRVTLVLPDGPCLHRAGILVGDEVAPGYVTDDPRPAVIAFNGVVSSLGVATLLALVGAFPLQAARQILSTGRSRRGCSTTTSPVCASTAPRSAGSAPAGRCAGTSTPRRPSATRHDSSTNERALSCEHRRGQHALRHCGTPAPYE